MALVYTVVNNNNILVKLKLKYESIDSCRGPGSFNELCNSPFSACSSVCRSNLTCDSGKCK